VNPPQRIDVITRRPFLPDPEFARRCIVGLALGIEANATDDADGSRTCAHSIRICRCSGSARWTKGWRCRRSASIPPRVQQRSGRRKSVSDRPAAAIAARADESQRSGDVSSIALLFVVASFAACFWPARRATRLDPVHPLRCG